MEQIKEFIMSIDPKVLYIIAGIMIIMFIITLFKKAIKAAITIIIIAIVIAFMGPTISKLQEQVNFKVEDGAITFNIDDTEHTVVDIKSINNVVIQEENEQLLVDIFYEDKELNIKLPIKTKNILEKTLDKNDIKYEIID